ncbi:MAG TPA: methyltransferase [Bryobacteraceae bacterium]|nr:methyltransferase [Bryobacteraceae bacterium]
MQGNETWRVFEHPIYAASRASRMANLFASFPPERLRGKRVLEAGCGTGELGEFLERHGCRVVSVDAREEFLVRLRQKYPSREAHRVDLDHWDPERLGRFDAVLAFGILYHLAEPEAFLAGCARITGTILLETMTRDSPWADCVRVTDSQPEGAWSRIGSRPTTAWIARVLERHGFVAEDISSSRANWYGPYPSLYDWEPQNSGGWTRGNAVLRRMLICRGKAAAPPAAPPPAPYLLHRIEPAVALDLAADDLESARAMRTLRHAGYCLRSEQFQGNRAAVVFERQESAGAELRPLLVHVHIPKCAGTSFRRLLYDSFGARHRDIYPEETVRPWTREEWLRLVLENPETASFSSHSVRVFPPIAGDRRLLYVAFLRDPLRRYVSHLTYFQKQFQSLPEDLRARLPEDCAQLSQRELAAWLQANQPDSFHRSLLTVNFLAEQTWVDRVGGMLGLAGRWLDSGTILYAGFEPVRLALATALLDDFFFVGLVEEMETSLRLLRRKLEPYGLRLANLPLPLENVSAELAGDLTWLHPSDRVGRVILEQLEADRMLYHRFQARFRAMQE